MTPPPRGPALARLLLATAGIGVGTACSCDYTEMVAISDETYDALHAAQGSSLGEATCVQICAPPSSAPASTGASADTGFGGTTAYDVVVSCELVKIDWQRSAVQCEMTDPGCGIGRRPVGLQALPPGQGTLGEHFAHIAWLEAASVVAFQQLADALRRHEAPAALQQGALTAAADEARHAREMTALARRFGAEVPPVAVRGGGIHGLFELARHNATEGCVGEAIGAVQAAYAARHATDPAVASVMATIARDEARHAVLSFAIDDWLRPRLGAAQRRAVDHALTEAIAAFHAAPPSLRGAPAQRAGVAPEVVQAGWLQHLHPRLWAA